MAVDLKGELPKRMKDAMIRKDGYVFKVRAVGQRKNEGTEGLALKIITLVQESHGSGVGRQDLEDMIRKEIVQVYDKEEDKKNEKGEKDNGEERGGGGNSGGLSTIYEQESVREKEPVEEQTALVSNKE